MGLKVSPLVQDSLGMWGGIRGPSLGTKKAG